MQGLPGLLLEDFDGLLNAKLKISFASLRCGLVVGSRMAKKERPQKRLPRSAALLPVPFA